LGTTCAKEGTTVNPSTLRGIHHRQRSRIVWCKPSRLPADQDGHFGQWM